MTHKKPELHARLPESHFKALIDASLSQGCTLSELTRRIVGDYLATPLDTDSHLKQYYCLMSQADKKLFEQWRSTNGTRDATPASTPAALMMLEKLELQLDGFVSVRESECTGKSPRFSWAFGLDASDEYFETAEECLSSFLRYLNGLNFSYKAPVTALEEEREETLDW